MNCVHWNNLNSQSYCVIWEAEVSWSPTWWWQLCMKVLIIRFQIVCLRGKKTAKSAVVIYLSFTSLSQIYLVENRFSRALMHQQYSLKERRSSVINRTVRRCFLFFFFFFLAFLLLHQTSFYLSLSAVKEWVSQIYTSILWLVWSLLFLQVFVRAL